MNAFDALLGCEPRLADSTLAAFLRYADEISRAARALRGSRRRAAAGRRRDRHAPHGATARVAVGA